MPSACSFRAVTGPDAPQRIDRQLLQERARRAPGGITVSPSGFFHPEAIFARNLLGATPAEAVRPRLFADRRLQPARDRHCRAVLPGVVGDVEIGFVERQRLDEGRDAAEDLEHLLRHRPVPREVGTDQDQFRAEADRPGHRHGGAHAEGRAS